MRKAVFLHSPEFDQIPYPPACPFDSSRAGRTRQTILAMGLLGGPSRAERAPVAATRAELAAYHTPHYLDVLAAAQGGHLDVDGLAMGLGTPDCPLFAGMYDYAALAAGASLTGARCLLHGEADVAFNPSGGYHHAMAARAAGFCYLNDVVLAAMELAAAGRKVLFLDIDVHHCDGVQDAFYGRRDILTLSLHETGRALFPGTGFEEEIGAGEGIGYTVNIPLPVGTDDTAYRRAFAEAAWPVMQAFGPDVIIVEIGMDALAGDPLAHLHLTNNVHAEILARVVGMGKPILATGGGGYHIENTVRGWALAWSVLCGEQADEDDFTMGMGGVMLQNTDWAGGLRDRVLLSGGGRRDAIDAEITATIAKIRRLVFPHHGL